MLWRARWWWNVSELFWILRNGKSGFAVLSIVIIASGGLKINNSQNWPFSHHLLYSYYLWMSQLVTYLTSECYLVFFAPWFSCCKWQMRRTTYCGACVEWRRRCNLMVSCLARKKRSKESNGLIKNHIASSWWKTWITYILLSEKKLLKELVLANFLLKDEYILPNFFMSPCCNDESTWSNMLSPPFYRVFIFLQTKQIEWRSLTV